MDPERRICVACRIHRQRAENWKPCRCSKRNTSWNYLQAEKYKAVPFQSEEGACHLDSFDLQVAKVRVLAGPIKGTVWFTPWVYFADTYLDGDPIVISGEQRKIPGAYEKDDLFTFDEAVNAGDRSLYEGLLSLRRVVLLNNWTRGLYENEGKVGVTCRVRISTGAFKGSLLYCIQSKVAHTELDESQPPKHSHRRSPKSSHRN